MADHRLYHQPGMGQSVVIQTVRIVVGLMVLTAFARGLARRRPRGRRGRNY